MSLLSEQGIINNVYDAVAQALRTTATLQLSGVTLSVDAVKIEDGSSSTRAKVKNDGTDDALVVTQNNQPLPTGAATAANQSIIINKLTHEILSGVPVTVTNTVTVNLPTGASTSANQSIIIDKLNQEILSGIVVISTASTFTDVTSGTTNVQALTATSNLKLLGYSASETSGTPALAEVILRHGTSNAAPIISYIKLGPGESVRDWFGDKGLAVPSGVLVDRNAVGTSQITLYHKIEV